MIADRARASDTPCALFGDTRKGPLQGPRTQRKLRRQYDISPAVTAVGAWRARCRIACPLDRPRRSNEQLKHARHRDDRYASSGALTELIGESWTWQ